jgi:hypothetical protein
VGPPGWFRWSFVRDWWFALVAWSFCALTHTHLAVRDWNASHWSFSAHKIIRLSTLRLLNHNKWVTIWWLREHFGRTYLLLAWNWSSRWSHKRSFRLKHRAILLYIINCFYNLLRQLFSFNLHGSLSSKVCGIPPTCCLRWSPTTKKYVLCVLLLLVFRASSFKRLALDISHRCFLFLWIFCKLNHLFRSEHNMFLWNFKFWWKCFWVIKILLFRRLDFWRFNFMFDLFKTFEAIITTPRVNTQSFKFNLMLHFLAGLKVPFCWKFLAMPHTLNIRNKTSQLLFFHLWCLDRLAIDSKLPEVLIDHTHFLIDFVGGIVQLNAIWAKYCGLNVSPPVELRKVVLFMSYGVQKWVHLGGGRSKFRRLENTPAVAPIPLGNLI